MASEKTKSMLIRSEARLHVRGLVSVSLFLVWFSALASDPEVGLLSSEVASERSGGGATVFDATAKAFSFPVPNLTDADRSQFFAGRSFFKENWVAAPASTAGRDGLGPLFNTRSCSACHFNDGRSRPPSLNQPLTTMLMRISIPGFGPHQAPLPEPTYGGQIQGQSILGVPREADVYVEYEEVAGQFEDGEPFSLRKPTYTLRNFGYGPVSEGLLMSPRVAPAVFGLGLLEAISEATLLSLAQTQARQSQGIAGRLNLVWSEEIKELVAGRFGWKAEQPTVLSQTAAAFAGDMGLTSSIVPVENHTYQQRICGQQPNGGDPEVSDQILRAVANYTRLLGVPARRNTSDPVVRRGQQLFHSIQCASCHVPTLQTGRWSEFPQLTNQTIHPFTDLLLHDMGEGLTDNRPVYQASGRDWRTPPLWGIGLLGKVNGHTYLLHDGRARNLTEAILWHGGEAQAARDQFRALAKTDRDALISFLQSL